MNPMNAKKVSESRTEMSQLMLPQHANMAGTVYGGTILSIADSVAYGPMTVPSPIEM